MLIPLLSTIDIRIYSATDVTHTSVHDPPHSTTGDGVSSRSTRTEAQGRVLPHGWAKSEPPVATCAPGHTSATLVHNAWAIWQRRGHGTRQPGSTVAVDPLLGAPPGTLEFWRNRGDRAAALAPRCCGGARGGASGLRERDGDVDANAGVDAFSVYDGCA